MNIIISHKNAVIANAYMADDSNPLFFHFHNAYELIYIADGSAEFVIDEKRHICGRHSVVFLNQMEKHQMIPMTLPYVRYIVMIDPDYFNRLIIDETLCSIFSQRPVGFQNGFALEDEHARIICRLMEQCAAEATSKTSYYEAEIMLKLTEILITLYRSYRVQFPVPPSDNTIRTVATMRNFIDEFYLDDMTLSKISKEFHTDKYHLMKIFKQVTGYTIKQYIILKQISFAKNLLFYTDDNIVHIASTCGFNSASNFIRAFQKHEKLTPLSFRKKLRAEIKDVDSLPLIRK